MVHHRNHQKGDNVSSNLVMMTKAAHLALHAREKRQQLWTGCGSGRHRSVAVTEEVGDSLRGEGYQVIIEHQERDSWPRRSRQHRHPIVTEDWENRATDAFPQ